jgi:hypothetical protein
MTEKFIAVKGEKYDVLADFIAISINSAGFNTQKWSLTQENKSFALIRFTEKPIKARTTVKKVDFLVFSGIPNIEDLKLCNENAVILSIGKKKLKNAFIRKNKLKSFIINCKEDDVSTLLGAFVKVFKQISLKNAKIAVDIIGEGNKTAIENGFRTVK